MPISTYIYKESEIVEKIYKNNENVIKKIRDIIKNFTENEIRKEVSENSVVYRFFERDGRYLNEILISCKDGEMIMPRKCKSKFSLLLSEESKERIPMNNQDDVLKYLKQVKDIDEDAQKGFKTGYKDKNGKFFSVRYTCEDTIEVKTSFRNMKKQEFMEFTHAFEFEEKKTAV